MTPHLLNQLAQFFAAIERRAFRIAAISLDDTDDAVGAVQFAMMHMARSCTTRPSHEWGPYFHRFLNEGVRRYERRAKFRTMFMRLFGRKTPGDHAPGRVNSVNSRRRNPTVTLPPAKARTALEQALRNLPDPQRQAFILRLWEGYDSAQTAKAMSCSEAKVKIYFSRAVIALRQALGEQWQQ